MTLTEQQTAETAGVSLLKKKSVNCGPRCGTGGQCATVRTMSSFGCCWRLAPVGDLNKRFEIRGSSFFSCPGTHAPTHSGGNRASDGSFTGTLLWQELISRYHSLRSSPGFRFDLVSLALGICEGLAGSDRFVGYHEGLLGQHKTRELEHPPHSV